jgi:hypothetical protein
MPLPSLRVSSQPPCGRAGPAPSRPQGASPAEVVQKLYSSALRGAVRDDALGYGTLFPANKRDLPDLSATPNRLLQSRVGEAATLSPSVLRVGPGDVGPRGVELRLLARPAAAVTITAAAASAWDGRPLADVAPTSAMLQPGDWNASGLGYSAVAFTVQARGVSEGTYFVEFDFA